MSLTDEIMTACADDNTSISSILRKCLILASELDSPELKAWAGKELEGYDVDDDIPAYRIMGITAKGVFLGGFGAQLNDQPLPSGNLDEKHRHWATTATARQGIAALEALVSKDATGSAQVYWPADLVAHYQSKFIRGYALNRAWQEIPIPGIIEIVDSVRTKVLKFILELRERLGNVEAAITTKSHEQIAPVVQNVFNTVVFGGTAAFGSQKMDISNQSIVVQGDIFSLKGALRKAGLDNSDIQGLEGALEADAASPSLQEKPRVREWIGKAATNLVKAGGAVAKDVAKTTLTTLISAYLGLPPSG